MPEVQGSTPRVLKLLWMEGWQENEAQDIRDSAVFCRTNLKRKTPSSSATGRIEKSRKNQFPYCRDLPRKQMS